MPEQDTTDRATRRDEILDALADMLAERLDETPAYKTARAQSAPTARPTAPAKQARPQPRPQPKAKPTLPKPGDPGWTPPLRQPAIGLDRALSRMLTLVLALTVLLNIPVNRHGVSLARILPDADALVIRDGLVLKGSGPEIYQLEDEKLRWISSMIAFEHLGLVWDDVHVVDDTFLERFESGEPIHILLKCSGSPHVYRIEAGEKRWIKDIPTFVAEGHIWEEVHIVTCRELRAIPDGPPIPPDAGTPPQP